VSDWSSNLFQIAAGRSTKLLFLNQADTLSEDWMNWIRSLHIEHVSPAHLLRQEICRSSPLGLTALHAQQRGIDLPGENIVALLRRWFHARKPDAGFALCGFPATLLQARIFDEWLDARDESLNAVLAASTVTDSALVDYYRTYGLLYAQPLTAPLQ
jgi:adenylate kinase